jgi:two-component system osmolarity sensor histidine kinase EnvZ
VSRLWPRSLFARTAWLIAGALAFFSLIAWMTLVWTALIPAAEATAHVLAQRVEAAATAYESGAPLPQGVEISDVGTSPETRRRLDVSLSLYLSHLRRQLRADLPTSEIVITRAVIPTEVWIRMSRIPDRWFVLRWQAARPETPAVMGAVVLAGALLSLLAAALFARRLTAPLAALVAVTQRVGAGQTADVDTNSGATEVRALAVAFQGMSQRLAQLNEQRELMLAGLSHDLRSPLARMRIAVDLLDTPDSTLREQITVDVEEVDRMVGQLMHYVRAGYRETPSLACADDIVRDSVAPYLRDEDLHTELSASEPRALPVDSVRRVVANLVQNAFEYGRAPITVRTSLGARELLISVEDRGPGISVQDWHHAIQPFHRLRETPGTGHSGLGLATVERLVRAAQGTLASRKTPDGFVVEVTLPTA